MALPKLENLKQEDLIKLIRFSSDLSESFHDFINVTFRSLETNFDLPISTYTIFGYNRDGTPRVLRNYSNFFSSSDLEFYNTKGIVQDRSFRQSTIDWAKNSNKYVFVTDYRKQSEDSFAKRMQQSGIRFQVRLGAHKRGVTPLHVLSVYLPEGTPEPDEYQMQLFSAIGRLFSEQVGNYKRISRCETTSGFFLQYLDMQEHGVAIYEPFGNVLEYNRAFAQLIARNCGAKPARTVINDLLDRREGGEQSASESIAYDDIQFTVYEINDAHIGNFPFQVILAQQEQTATAAKPALRKQYLQHELTLREIEVITLIESGLSNQEIAKKLVISMSTVKTHIKNIFSKYAVHSRTELLRKLQEEAQGL